MPRFFKATHPSDPEGKMGMGLIYAKSEHRAREAFISQQFVFSKATDKDILRYSKGGGVIVDDTGTLEPIDLTIEANKAAIQQPSLGSNSPLPNHELPLEPSPAAEEGSMF